MQSRGVVPVKQVVKYDLGVVAIGETFDKGGIGELEVGRYQLSFALVWGNVAKDRYELPAKRVRLKVSTNQVSACCPGVEFLVETDKFLRCCLFAFWGLLVGVWQGIAHDFIQVGGKLPACIAFQHLAQHAFAFFFLLISPVGTVLKVIAVLGAGLSMSGIYPTTLSTMEQRYNSSTVATGLCIGTATVGAIIMPSVVGTVAEKAGIEGGIATISLALAVMVILMVIKVITARKKA